VAGTDEAEAGKGGRRQEQAGADAKTADFEPAVADFEGEHSIWIEYLTRFCFLSLESKNCMSAVKYMKFVHNMC
jgi:hypothetical protein